MAADHLEHYHEHGYAVVRGVFDRHEVGELAAAFDRQYARGLGFGASFRQQNTLYRLGDDPNLGRIVRMVQWPSYVDTVLARYRNDPRVLEILAPLLGQDLKQIINQMHWKPPGAVASEWGYHQDIRFRRPREAYRSPARSYIQTGIAVDPHSEHNGAMTVLPGSHKLGELEPSGGRVMDRPLDDGDLVDLGLNPADVISLTLEPGDVAFWHLHTIHGSGPNRSAIGRRFYLNGYVVAADCDRGEWAFQGGAPTTLGEPVLVHYEELFERPEPHYLETG
jgi:ectoine hydroxylase-related dioxygenase (phytanoyl-CoA dioxygenase family)